MADRAHFYETIPGWFDYADLYAAWVRQLADGAHVVEVGGWKGKSAAYMGVEIANSGKRIRYDVVDTWQGSADEPIHQDDPDVQNGRLFDVFLANTAPVSEFIRPIRSTSVEAASSYDDASLDAVFLDGGHDTASVVADCEAWWPKVRPGGILAGHDRDWQTVARGVRAFEQCAGVRSQVASLRSWLIEKPVLVTDWAVPEDERAVLIAICSNERQTFTPSAKSAIHRLFGHRLTDAVQAHGFYDYEFEWCDRFQNVETLRDNVLMQATIMGASHVLFLDSDMTWPEDVLHKMLRHHSAGMVGGMYFLKAHPYKPVALDRPFIDHADHWMTKYHYADHVVEAEDLVPVALLGMGCTLVPMRITEAIGKRPWFENKPDNVGRNSITEDVAFCAKARAVGCPILVDPSVKCGHIAQKEITVTDYRRAHYLAELMAVKKALEGEDLPFPSPDEMLAIFRTHYALMGSTAPGDEGARARARAALAEDTVRAAAQEQRRARARGSAA